MREPRYSVFLHTFDQCVDRFCTQGYTPGHTLSQQFAQARGLDGITAVDLVLRAEMGRDALSRELTASGLTLASVLPDLSCSPLWQQGAFTAPDPAVRRQAVQTVCEGMDFAAAHGCSTVTLWPGQDGYDYLFQADYQREYEALRAGIAACAAHRDDVALCLEYKPCEPRTHCYLDSCAAALALIGSLPQQNLGVAIDFGHTLMNNNAPAQALALCRAHGVRHLHLHLNDSFARMDDDLMPGTAHTLYYLEFFYWLRRVDYQGYITFDLFPYREDAAGAVQESRRWLDALWRLASACDPAEVEAVQRVKNGVAASRLMRRMLLPGAG